MKCLIVTSQLAKSLVEEQIKKCDIPCEVLALPKPVASLLTPEYIASFLKRRDLRNYDLILVPGLVQGDVKIIEDKTGVKTYKGPKFAADIPLVLKLLNKTELSTVKPACEILKEKILSELNKELEKVELSKEELLRKPQNMEIGKSSRSLAVGRDFPMRVIAEIVDAPLLSENKLRKRAKYYAECGADIIDIGMTARKTEPGLVRRLISIVREEVGCPVAIDTQDPNEINAAISYDIDLVISLNDENLEEISPENSTAFVITPTVKSHIPLDPYERVKALERNIELARRYGFKKIIGDIVLNPPISPGITPSLFAYYLFSRKHSEIPMLLGVGNVTELIDADSVGVNALLATMASEMGICLLLTTEASDKTRGSVYELAKAAKMAFISQRRNSPPKDLGVSLLVLKEKRSYRDHSDSILKNTSNLIKADGRTSARKLEDKYFKIAIDRENSYIVLSCFKEEKLLCTIIGKKATELYLKAIEMGLVSELSHAAYLGKELAKAEIALKIGRSYLQDEDLFSL